MDLINTLTPYLDQEEIDALLKSFDQPDTHAVVLNTLKINDNSFLKNHKGVKKHPFVPHAFIFDKSIYQLGKEIAYDQGLYSIQDPSAMIPAYLLNPSKNEIVLDMCASPGGKSIQCALMMENQGILIANDISYPRAKDLSQNIERMGLGNVIVTSTDFSFAYKHYLKTFDKILLDAPCLGSAMFRKNSDSKEDWSLKKVENCARIQSSLLDIAYEMLKDGGTICYSTCSFSFQEDDQQILEFKERHPESILTNIKNNKMFTRSKQVPEAIHILPTHFEGEGQFACLISKPGKLSQNTFVKKQSDKVAKLVMNYALDNRSNELHNECVYSMSYYFDISHLNVLRYGVKVCDYDGKYNPNHNLSHYLNSDSSYEMNESQLKKYLHGDTFDVDLDDGFKIVSYKHFNLGWVKVVNKQAKNHYPKGLRKSI